MVKKNKTFRYVSRRCISCGEECYGFRCRACWRKGKGNSPSQRRGNKRRLQKVIKNE